MASNRVGCSSNKTILVDPNLFDGQSSSNNISVPLEDLSISVQLTTNKKARTVLSTDKTVIEPNQATSESSHKLDVTFIEGSEINGHKVLTTQFTDLTTNFEEGNGGENLGITSIEVDFNTSYAPMVTIQFIDLRGSAIFQNEANIKAGKNKYATFFQLPYPIFSLTIKGYYGHPVTYCLHMLKMSSRFNSQTGNFEITCSFVGYTYAMLSDMLLGYLKAVPHTTLGKAKYEELRKIKPNLLTLNQLMDKIAHIDELAKKIKADNTDSQQLKVGEEKKNQLSVINTILNNLGNDLDIVKGKESYPFIIMKNVPTTTTEQTNQSALVNQNNASTISQPTFTYNTSDSSQKITNYNTSITEAITKYNEGDDFAEFRLDVNLFTNINLHLYKGITKKMTNPDSNESEDLNLVRTNTLSSKLGYQDDFNKTRDELYKSLVEDGVSESQELDVYDVRHLYAKIRDTNNKIDIQQLKLTESLANTLKTSISKEIGFDTSVRNIIEVFTTAVEVWLEVLYDVSVAADTLPNDKRTRQLKTFKDPENYDIKQNSIKGSNSALEPKYYPWPDYRKKSDDKLGFIETYIGKPGELPIPTDVDEVAFINDLLAAFLKSQTETDQTAIQVQEDTTNWAPVNPLDSRLFTDIYPYRRFEGNDRNEAINLMLIRAIIFLGFSNRGLKAEEIIAMAEAEGEAVLTDLANESVKASFKVLSKKDFVDAKIKLDGEMMPVMKPLTNANGEAGYYYNYVYGDNGAASKGNASSTKFLPINDTFAKSWMVNRNDSLAANGQAMADSGRLFLSNYTTTTLTTAGGELANVILSLSAINPKYLNPEIIIPKPNDGGVYIKFITPTEYSGSKSQPILGSDGSDGTIIYSVLNTKTTDFPKDGEGVGFNVFGGNFGQEFRKMDWGDPDLETLGFRFMFYEDGAPGKLTYNKSNGLGLARSISASDGGTTTTKFDKTKNSETFRIPKKLDSILDFIDGAHPTHKGYGSNKRFVLDYNNGKSDVSYPYVNFNVYYDTDKDLEDGGKLVPISLFGSRLYYEQTSETAKAFLFLHTLPWTGLVGVDQDAWLFELTDNRTIFEVPSILNTLAQRAGFISVPKLWPAFIGGLLWRMDESDQQFGGSGPTDPILWKNGSDYFVPTITSDSHIPTRYQYLTARQNATAAGLDYPDAPMTFTNETITVGDYLLSKNNYKTIDSMLITLPEQAKAEFKQQFFDFVATGNEFLSDWDRIKSQLEIFDGDGSAWVNAYSTTMSSVSISNDTSNLSNTFVRNLYNKKSINGESFNYDNYIIFAPIPNDDGIFKNNYVLEIKDDSEAVKVIMDLYVSETIMVNMSYKIWEEDNTTFFELIGVNPNDVSDFNPRESVFLKETDLDIYLGALLAKITPETSTLDDKKKQQEQAIFGTADENLIKLQLYRTCKHTYDKWIGGAKDKNIIFQCGERNALDAELAKKYSDNKSSTPHLIDSFRFVDRSFADIGDKLLINPIPVNQFLIGNPNSSFYDAVSSLLASNNFNFIPLPSYINYKDDETLKSIFTPLAHVDAMSGSTCGPAFVCVYTGQHSMHLDFGESDYTNDGFDIRCNKDGNIIGSPEDFIGKKAEAYENNVAVFAVNYSQQNQNIFKDITLDQNEFTDTAESLQIMDDISKKGAENNRTLAGQNLYNVNAVRSYKAEVQMMGNAMIQPMMYFQLNNIPMFHGAYMIIHVKHSIKPNTMSTHFTGVRIRAPKTELLDVGVLYMSLLDSIGVSNSSDGASNKYGGAPTTGPYSIGGNCGANTTPISLGVVSNSDKYYATKPLRDMIASVESGSCDKNYNAYNYYVGKSIKSVLPCGKGNNSSALTPLTMTVGEILTEQKAGNMFAVGKYQLVYSNSEKGPKTFEAMVNGLGFSNSDVFNEDRQEQAGEWLIKKKRPELKKYLEGKGSENELALAITDLAREFASLPSYHRVISNGKVDTNSILGFNSIQTVYCEPGVNACNSKYCTQDVAKALIETWTRLNPNKTPEFGYDKVLARVQEASVAAGAVSDCPLGFAKTNFDITSTAVIIGDSGVGVLANMKGNPLKENGIAISFNCYGQTVPWLVKQLTKDGIGKTYMNVKTIYVKIGTNDGYKPNQIVELNNLINAKYPKAKKVVLPGSIGWGNVALHKGPPSTPFTKADQDNYYKNNFVPLGWTYQYPEGETGVTTQAGAHDPDSVWFKKMLAIMLETKAPTFV